jgi:peroxiredoxin
MKRKLGALVALALIIMAGVLLMKPLPPAPNVTFMTLDGQTLKTTDLRGKVWLVNFWATTCTTCVKEMPALADTYKKFSSQGFELLAVAMHYDPPNYVAAFAKERGLPFKVALDARDEVAAGFGGVRLTPTTFLIDKQGRIVQQYLGEPDFVKLNALIAELLAEPV